MTEGIQRDYAEMFITMSYDFIREGITWETYLRNIEIAVKNMRRLTAEGGSDGEIIQHT